jgi:hypothetical protein
MRTAAPAGSGRGPVARPAVPGDDPRSRDSRLRRPAKGAKSAAGEEDTVKLRESGNPWLYLVPGTLLALVVIVPTAFLLNNRRKHRAIERRYRAERGL